MPNKLRLGSVLLVPLLAWMIACTTKPVVDTPPGKSLYEQITQKNVNFAQMRSILEANHVPVIATALQRQLRAKNRQQSASPLNRSAVESILKKPGLMVYRRTSLKCTWQVSTKIVGTETTFSGIVYSSLWGYVSNNTFKRSGEMIVSSAPPAFAKVKDGMSYSQVKSILGEPSEAVQEITTVYMWKNSAGSILGVFFNNDQVESIGVWVPDGSDSNDV